ncbi:hypothetical protein WJX72_009397 [[Myrmecia] bisecta]|uniref:Hydroxyproline O-arabinosyltransferase-like domain-containing protein n=1 Tax=[Myrmecia] bisecta TaxID=41462 RepID=A0AAW1QSR7_9CHLO
MPVSKTLCLCILCATGSLADRIGVATPLIHTVVTTQCNLYQDWQVLALYWTWQRVGSPGLFTRIAACSMSQILNRAAFDPCPVYYTEDTPDPEHTGDSYSPFNKPWGLRSWLEHAKPEGDYFLLLDADMTFHRSFTVEEFGVRAGWGAAQNMWYMADLNRFMAEKMMPPDTPIYDDWLAAPFTARRADEVGEFFLYHEADIKRLAPLYWDYSIKARTFHERHAGELPPGTPADRPWIAEMYGGAMAAAAAGVRHYGQNSTVWHPPGYPGNEGVPWLVSHYAWNAEAPNTHLKWNKHTYRGFTALRCPPWHLDQLQTVEAWDTTYNISAGGMFDHPPRPSLLTTTGRELLKDLANIEMVALANEAFCELHHLRRCPPSPELDRECGMAKQVVSELVDRYLELEGLTDGNIYCMDDKVEVCKAKLRPIDGGKAEWSCQDEPANRECQQTCGVCPPKHPLLDSTWYRLEYRARQKRQAERKAAQERQQAASDLAAQQADGEGAAEAQHAEQYQSLISIIDFVAASTEHHYIRMGETHPVNHGELLNQLAMTEM